MGRIQPSFDIKKASCCPAILRESDYIASAAARESDDR